MSSSKNQLTQEEKAGRWDELIGYLRQPGLRDTYIHRLSGVRRAVYLLLADQEELPPSLVTELKSYALTLDALYLEAADGFTCIEGVLNRLPTYITESIAGEICQDDTEE